MSRLVGNHVCRVLAMPTKLLDVLAMNICHNMHAIAALTSHSHTKTICSFCSVLTTSALKVPLSSLLDRIILGVLGFFGLNLPISGLRVCSQSGGP